MRTTRKIQWAITLAMVSVFVGLFCVRILGAPAWENVESCSVYQSFYSQSLPEKEGVLFSSTSVPHTPPNSNSETLPLYAPTHFFQYTGEYELIETGEGMPPYKQPLSVIIERNTSSLLKAVVTRSPKRIQKCFAKQNETPRFYNGKPSSYLQLRETFLGHSSDGTITPLALSPVGFSQDRQTALIYVEDISRCGLCGWGAYFLFEKQNNIWEFVGRQGVWVG